MTDTGTATITSFVTARLDEWEAVALAVGLPGNWYIAGDISGDHEVRCDSWPGERTPGLVVREDDGGLPLALSTHIALNQPALVLRTVAAHRAIVEACGNHHLAYGASDARSMGIIRALAAIWSDHDEFREEWR